MMHVRSSMITLLAVVVLSVPLTVLGQPKSDIKQVYPKMYPAEGLIWKGRSVQESCWNKICEDPQGRIWFTGGDHWGTDRSGGIFDDFDGAPDAAAEAH